jgi:hypothetical protein
MLRREFIAGIGGATVAWPFAAHVRQKSMPVILTTDEEPRRLDARQRHCSGG